MNSPKNFLMDYAESGAAERLAFFKENSSRISEAALKTAIAIAKGHKLLICGNGGSAGDAQHVAGEFVNRFMLDRPALPAIALTVDTSVLTAIGNDSSFDLVFARQVEALGRQGDILLAISTSGKSANIQAAVNAAKDQAIFTIGLTGPAEIMNSMCDLTINARAQNTPRIQELHLAFEHVYCSLVDYYLFENPEALKQFL